MVSRASLFLALRYLRPKRSFVSVITVISILGVAVGVLMMVVVRAVMLGFEVDFRETLMGAEPHILVSREQQAGAAGPGWQEALKAARQQAGVVSAAPYVGGKLYLAREDYQTGGPFIGVTPGEAGALLAKLTPHLMEGSLDLAPGTLVISDQNAYELGLRIGDEVSVYAEQNVNKAVRQYTALNEEDSEDKKKALRAQIKLSPQTLRVSGILRMNTAGPTGYLALGTAQELFQLGQAVTGLALEIQEPMQAAAFARSLGEKLPGWKFALWTDAGESRLAAMQNEQTMMQFVLSIIALVAAFSVMNTTITVTTQKRREIGVLAALGTRPGQVVNIFLLQAVIVGVVGTLAGLAGSFVVLAFRNDIRAVLTALTGGQVHAVEGVFLSTIPAYVQPWDVALTCLISVALCVVAGFIPAWAASRLDAAEALRD